MGAQIPSRAAGNRPLAARAQQTHSTPCLSLRNALRRCGLVAVIQETDEGKYVSNLHGICENTLKEQYSSWERQLAGDSAI